MSGRAAALALALLAAAPADAQDAWPSKPLRWVVAYAPGGFGDLRARKVGAELAKALGQPVVVENRPGAGGVVGTDAVAKAAPDGYTLGMGNFAALAVNVSLQKKLPYDVERDFTPVVLLERSPLFLMAGPALPAANLGALLAAARAQPGKIGFGSSGIGGAHHLCGEMLRLQAGIDIVHVPYKGGAPAAADLLAGHLPMMFEMGYAAMPSIRSGRARALAVTAGERLALAPEVPTMAEAGMSGFEVYNWQGVILPSATPRAIVGRLNRELNAILARPDQREALAQLASQPAGGTPESFRDFIRAETARWARVVHDAKIQPE